MAEAIGKGFERILRWIYPGALFLVLLALSWPNFYGEIIARPTVLIELIVIGVAGGFAAYLIQSNVLNQLISIITLALGWEINALESGQDGPKCLKCLADKFFDPWAKATKARWSTKNDINPYLDYA